MSNPSRLAVAAAVSVACIFATPSFAHADATPASEDGHLTVHAMCVDRLATPERGLNVFVDGVRQTSKGTDHDTFLFSGDDGALYVGSTSTGVGFDAPTGRHRVRIEADDCEPLEQSVDIGSPTKIEASLPITDATWMGPSGAPNGFTIGLLGFHTTVPSSLHSGLHSEWSPGTSFGVDASSMYGVAITGGYVHRFFAAHFDLDVSFGSAPATGTNADGTTTSFDAHLGMIETDARLGLRYPMGDVTVEAGSGFGYGLWIAGDSSDGAPNFGSASKVTLDFPLWASVMLKPTCDFGVEFGATYHVDPLAGDDSTTMLTAGLILEPNGACSRTPSFEVT